MANDNGLTATQLSRLMDCVDDKVTFGCNQVGIENPGYVLLVFDYDDPKSAQSVSNCHPDTVKNVIQLTAFLLDLID